MAYTIRNADGTVLLTLPDNQIDQVSTSVTLVGRNYSSYGQYYNNNLVVMLENFASDGVPPRSPLVGQLWYNRSDGRLYAYTPNSVFSPVGVATVSPSEPTAPNIGDLWIDSINKQLYFTSDGLDFTLVGPISSTATSTTSTFKNGWYAESIVDGSANSNTVAVLYNNNVLLAIASSSTFSFASSYGGMNSVDAGINLNTSIPGIKFVGTATSADSADAINTFTGLYLEVTPVAGFQTTDGELNISNDGGMTIAGASGYSLSFGNNDGYSTQIISDTDDLTPLTITVNTLESLRLSPASRPTVSFWFEQDINNRFVDIFADTLVRGSFTATTVITTSLNVKSKGITIGYGQVTPSDSFVDGGGITLVGATNHTLTWSNARSAWESNANFNLDTGLTYKINNQTVLSSSALGSGITSAPGVTSLGTLSYLTVTNISITSGTIATVAAVGAANLTLNPAGTGTVDVSYSKITSVSTGSNAYDAANIGYVNNRVAQFAARGYVLNMDITGIASPNVQIPSMLDVLLPIVDPYDATRILPDGSWVRILCTRNTVTFTGSAVINPPSVDYVDIGGNLSTQQFVYDIPNSAAFNTTATYTVSTKDVYEFIVTAGAWTANGANPIASF